LLKRLHLFVDSEELFISLKLFLKYVLKFEGEIVKINLRDMKKFFSPEFLKFDFAIFQDYWEDNGNLRHRETLDLFFQKNVFRRSVLINIILPRKKVKFPDNIVNLFELDRLRDVLKKLIEGKTFEDCYDLCDGGWKRYFYVFVSEGHHHRKM